MILRRDKVAEPLHQWVERHTSPDQIVEAFSKLEMLHAAIRAGRGLGIIHSRLADTEDTLLRCFDNIPELASPVMMLIAPDAYRLPEVRTFARFFAPRYAATFNAKASRGY